MALQIVEVVKAESTPPQAIVFHIVEVSFHRSMLIGFARGDEPNLESALLGIMLESRIEPYLARPLMPSHCGHVVVGHQRRNGLDVLECFLV